MADDENENDYDGIYAHKCDFYLFIYFVMCIFIFALVASAVWSINTFYSKAHAGEPQRTTRAKLNF